MNNNNVNVVAAELDKYKIDLLRIIKDRGKLNAVKYILDKKLGYRLIEIKAYIDEICDELLYERANFVKKACDNYSSLLASLKDMVFLNETAERNLTKEWKDKLKAAKEAIQNCDQ